MNKEEALAFLEALEASEDIKNPMGVLEALRTANEEAKTNREAVEELKTELEGLKGFRGKAKNTAVTRELKARGIKNPDRLVRLFDLDHIDFDDNGSLTGLDEQFETLTTEFPELVDAKRQAPPVDQFRKEEPEAKMSSTQQQLAALYNHSGQ